jgi:hypothetical protein
MGHIIHNLYELCVFGGSTNGPTMLYKPRTSSINLVQISMLQDELDLWCRTLPDSCRFAPGFTHHDETTENVLFLHKAVLRMIYLMAIAHMNRPRMLLESMSADSTSKVQAAAERIAEMFQYLQERNLVGLLPPLSVGFILFSLPAFLVEKKPGQNPRDLLGQQFYCCIRALWQLRDTWPIADYACFLIGQMIAKSTIGRMSERPEIPVQPTAINRTVSESLRAHASVSQPETVLSAFPTENTLLQGREWEIVDQDQTSFPPTTITPEPRCIREDTGTAMSSQGPDLAIATAASPWLDPILYSWADLAFDNQALPMDIAFPEIDIEGLDEFQNDFLVFSSNRHQTGQI